MTTDTMTGLASPVVAQPPISTELQNRLFGVLDYLGDLTKQGIDFAGQQVPLIAHDIVMYGAISGWVYTGLGLILIGIAVVLWRKIKDAEDSDASFLLMVGSVVLLSLGSLTFCMHLNDAIKVTFAPRLYLIEWVADQVKQLR